MLMFLAFVYLFVGIAHNISCLDEVVASSFAIENASDAADDIGGKPGVVTCDHCPACIPAVIPAPTVVLAPPAGPTQPVMAVASALVAGQFWLDTPPPKILT